jgi:hypothetical protein
VLLNSGYALLTKPLQPHIPGRTRDLELPAQAAQTLASTGTNHELHTLIPHAHKPPRHP